ncbi:MAG: hypothetical protein QXX51_02980 [Candidatus Bathyarchaeia archaeon]
MRSYIFTKKERTVIKNFLNKTAPRDDPLLMVILSRIKTFKDLASDIELYLALRKAIST